MSPTAGSPAPLLLVLGEEELLIDRAISGAVSAARKVDPEVERREAAAVGLSPLEFSDLVAPSLFAEPRVVVIRQAHESLEGDRPRRSPSTPAIRSTAWCWSCNTTAERGTKPWPTVCARPGLR